MKIRIVLSLVSAAFFAASSACYAATLSKTQANAIVTAALKKEGAFTPQCYPLVVQSVTVKGAWAFVFASCHTNPDAAVNAMLRETHRKWTFACSHGDDVMYAEKAMRLCGMAHAEALSLGFKDAPQ